MESLTDGQWLYLIINQILDDEEEFNKMCDSCQEKSQIKKCVVCSKNMDEINPNFDIKKFKELSKKAIKKSVVSINEK